MTDEKRIKAELLLDAIGDIDDSLLVSALCYKKPKPKYNTRVLALAASIAIVFCILIGSDLISRLSDMKQESSNPSDGENLPMAGEMSGSLDSIFDEMSDSEGGEYVTDPEDLPYFDGARIVWQYSGSDRYYYSRRLSEYDLWCIKGSIGRGKESGESSPSLNVKVWILLGDGRAVSPYLALSRGNISSGAIFDYEVEIIPDESFTRLIRSILS